MAGNGLKMEGKSTGSESQIDRKYRFFGLLTDDADKFESESYEIPVGEYP